MKIIEEKIEIDGISCKLLRGGKKCDNPILFLHGWGSRAERYRKVLEFLPEDFPEIVIPDLPGFGDSPVPETVWGIKEYWEWVEKLIILLGWKKLILAGHSFGGRLAIYAGVQEAVFLQGIILYAAAGTTKRDNAKLSLLSKIAKAGKALVSLPGLHFARPVAEKLLYRLIGNSDYVNAGAKKEIFKKVINEDLSEAVKKIVVSVYLLWGKDDTETPLEDAYYINRNVKDSELTVVANQGHLMHSRAPELFAREFAQIVYKLIPKIHV